MHFPLQLLIPLTAADAVQLIEDVLIQQEVNWALLLSYTATVVVLCPEAPTLLKGKSHPLEFWNFPDA